MTELLSFRGLADDPQGVLAAVHRLALVDIKLVANTSQGRIGVCERFDCYAELSVTALADSEHRNLRSTFYDPKIALGHVYSLAHWAGRL